MAFEELKDQLSDADKAVRSYVDTSREYYKLKAFKVASQSLAGFTKGLAIGILGLFALLFLSLAASWALGNAMGGIANGLMTVGGIYILLAFVAFLLRNKINKPLLKKLSKYYFHDHEN